MFHNFVWPADPDVLPLPSLALLRALDGDEGAHLEVVCALEPFDRLYLSPGGTLDPRMSKLRHARHSGLRRRLRVALRPIAGAGITISYQVVDGTPAASILGDIRGGGRDLLLLRTQSSGEGRIGGLTGELLLRSPVPVCCARDVGDDYRIRRIVAATDLSENSLSAFETALTLAEERGAAVTLLHLTPVFGPKVGEEMRRQLHREAKAALRRWRRSAAHLSPRRVPVEERVVSAVHTAAGILEHARSSGADLIVVASHGWSGLSSVLFGSTARRVIRDSPIPVLVSRSPVSRREGGSS